MRTLIRASILLLILAAMGMTADAQRINRGVRRAAVWNAGWNNWYAPVQYGAGGYWYYPYGAQTAYGNSVRAQADLIAAQGEWQRNAAAANKANEEARAQYLENKAKYEQMRREQRAATEARKAQELAERKQRAAERPIPKVADRYDRLPIEQFDPTTGEVSWPEALQSAPYAEDRTIVEKALLDQAQEGPSERTARIVMDACERMKDAVSSQLNDLGFEEYSRLRRFLGSLSVEGYHAMEDAS